MTGRPRRCGWLDIAGAQALAAAERRGRPVHHQARRAGRHGRDPLCTSYRHGRPRGRPHSHRRGSGRALHAGVRDAAGLEGVDRRRASRSRRCPPTRARICKRDRDADAACRSRWSRQAPIATRRSWSIIRFIDAIEDTGTQQQMTPQGHLGRVQRAGRAARAQRVRIGLPASTRSSASRAAACASATCCRGSTSSRSRSCRRTRTRRKAARSAASS